MHSRWTDRIDIYMGEDVDAAKAWGKKQATISWR
jgi:3D (Asp-Asp-Asp) domain-containing protein